MQGKEFDSLFDKKGYYKIEGLIYAEGENIVHVTASIMPATTAEEEYTFNVNLDMDK